MRFALEKLRQGLELEPSEAAFEFYKKMGFKGNANEMTLDPDDFKGCGEVASGPQPVDESQTLNTQARSCVIL